MPKQIIPIDTVNENVTLALINAGVLEVTEDGLHCAEEGVYHVSLV